MLKVPKIQYKFTQDGNKYQIYVYDDVQEEGRFNWETWQREESETSAKYFRERLAEIPEDAEIELFFNSNGGSVKEGTAIYNQLKRHKAHKTGYVDGVAHSIAFVMLQACDHRVMGEGTSALLHEMWACVAGNASQLRTEADQLDDLMVASRKLFMLRAKNITEEELKVLMENETMLTPDKALEYGFIDEIAGRKEDVPEGAQQAATDIKELRARMNSKDFSEVLEEFKELNKTEEPKQEVSAMDAFFNAFL
jgi:ATP-dependent Clp protease protease subunit